MGAFVKGCLGTLGALMAIGLVVIGLLILAGYALFETADESGLIEQPVGKQQDQSAKTNQDMEPDTNRTEMPQTRSDTVRRRVTMAMYQQVQRGMTYAEVVEILGQPTQELSRNRIEGVPGVMPTIETVMYSWENPDASNMNVIFQNARLVQKAQFGLR